MATMKPNAKVGLTFGPFSGGLNTYSDPSSIGDNELVKCTNFEVTLDGTLISRPPIQSIDNGSTIGFTERIYLIGTATIGGVVYIFGSNKDGVFYWSSGTWTLVTNTVACSCALQYNDVVYLLPWPNNLVFALGKWTPSGGYADVSPANLKTMMGGTNYGGSKLLIYNNRLFIIPGFSKVNGESRLIFSDPGNPEAYTASTQFVDVNPGDGQRLMEAIVQDDNLLLFKGDSTYVFTFTSNPADAELIRINDIIGAGWIQCVVPYENAIYVFHRGKVYEVINYNFQCISTKVPFETDFTEPTGMTRFESVFMSRIGDRLIVRWFNRLYVYGLRTKAWSRWVSDSESLENFGPIVHYLSASEDYYLAGSNLDKDFHLFRIFDGYTGTITESLDSTPVTITCTLETKWFDLQDPYHFKRLNWWGVDAMTKADLHGAVSTVVALFAPSWGDVMADGTLWSGMGTWGRMDSTTLTEDTIPVTSSNILRSFFRFKKSVRFRKAGFTISTSTDGSTVTGPVRVFGVTLVGSSKQVAPNAIN